MNKQNEIIRNFKKESSKAAADLLSKKGNIKKIKDLSTGKIIGYFLRSELGVDKENSFAEFVLNVSINGEYDSTAVVKNMFPRTMRLFGIRHLENDYDTYRWQRIIDFRRGEESHDIFEVADSFAYYMKGFVDSSVSPDTARKWLTRAILQAEDYYKDINSFRVHVITNIMNYNILV